MSVNSATMLAEALRLLRLGLSVIPIRWKEKKPVVAWKGFQKRLATEEEVVAWYRRWPAAGVGIICGAVSGVAVVDCDPRNGDGFNAIAPRLPLTPTVETGGGGRHYYFALTKSPITKIPALLPGVDLQAEASYVIAPPSVHPNGRLYRWLRGDDGVGLALGEVPLAPLPLVIRQLIALRHQQEEDTSPRPRNLRDSALTAGAVLSVLTGVRRCGQGWIALCPAHDDREQSLSISNTEGGKVLLHCFAGCSFAEILAALRGEAT